MRYFGDIFFFFKYRAIFLKRELKYPNKWADFQEFMTFGAELFLMASMYLSI